MPHISPEINSQITITVHSKSRPPIHPPPPLSFYNQMPSTCIIAEKTNFRSMLNCVNSLEPASMNSGIEHAALMISEEKTQHDSRKIWPKLRKPTKQPKNAYANAIPRPHTTCFLYSHTSSNTRNSKFKPNTNIPQARPTKLCPPSSPYVFTMVNVIGSFCPFCSYN